MPANPDRTDERDETDETDRPLPRFGDPHPTRKQRAREGREWQQTTPPAALGRYDAPSGRDPLRTLRAQDAERLPDLVPLRHERLAASPFAYYRGCAAVMADDLAPRPRTGGTVQLCGDAHVANFGVFGAPDRSLVFDLNDFDETFPGPFEWDVERLAASLELLARDRRLDGKAGRDSVRDMVRAYADAMRTLADFGTLDVWYARMDEEKIMGHDDVKADERLTRRMQGGFDKARSRTSMRAAGKLTETGPDGTTRFREEPPLISEQAVDAVQRAEALAMLREYRATLGPAQRMLLDRFVPVAVARKVVGVGSVGTRAYVVLLEGEGASDPLVLQLKEAGRSCLEDPLGAPASGPRVVTPGGDPVEHHGQRVVDGQRVIQAAGDVFLGWTTGPEGRSFYVRQLHDMKGSPDLGRINRSGLSALARLTGTALARAHARTGDPVALAAYVEDGTDLGKAMGKFARKYADQVEQDHAALVAALAASS